MINKNKVNSWWKPKGNVWFKHNDDSTLGKKWIVRKRTETSVKEYDDSPTFHGKGEMVAGPFKSKSRARHKADKLDNEYGAYAHMVEQYD